MREEVREEEAVRLVVEEIVRVEKSPAPCRGLGKGQELP